MDYSLFNNLSPVPQRYVVVVPNQNPQDAYPLRQVLHYELEYIWAGSGCIEVDGRVLPAQAGYSLYHYSHLFRQITGEPPLCYLHKTRIRHAKAQLLATNLPTESIMRECGFQNYPNFLRIFKTQTGTTPGQCQQEHRLETAAHLEEKHEIYV